MHDERHWLLVVSPCDCGLRARMPFASGFFGESVVFAIFVIISKKLRASGLRSQGLKASATTRHSPHRIALWG